MKTNKKDKNTTPDKDTKDTDVPKGKKPGDQFKYPASEDIYSKSYELDADPEDPSKPISENENPDAPNEKGFKDDVSGDDLDVPGSELDDREEGNGNEDEENNYYSLGGDKA